MRGQAVIAGTRVPVSVILDHLASGVAVDQITAENPTVTVAVVRAAAAVLASAGHNVDTVPAEGLVPDGIDIAGLSAVGLAPAPSTAPAVRPMLSASLVGAIPQISSAF